MTMTERELFEKWARELGVSVMKKADGQYVESYTRHVWDAFRAGGKAHLSQPAQAVDVGALAEDLFDWMFGLMPNGELFNAAIACDFAGAIRFKRALAEKLAHELRVAQAVDGSAVRDVVRQMRDAVTDVPSRAPLLGYYADELDRALSTACGKQAIIDAKYDNVLVPFATLMAKELHANAGKGDRPGWLSMHPAVGMLEIYYHAAKLQKSVKDDNVEGIREYAADVANMAMMLLDLCKGLDVVKPEEVTA